MQEVLFLNYEIGDEEPSVVGRVRFDGEQVLFDKFSNLVFAETLQKAGVMVGSKLLYPKDGLDFLRGLKYTYSGSRLRATGVREV